ncbi:MAG: DUF1292 domain-containing protein [Lachnospiraceae bacterium]
MEKIQFELEDGTMEEFFVEEQARIGGVDYLLVSDSTEEEAEAYILKDISKPSAPTACYVFVEDEKELIAVSKVFEQLMDDTDITM